MFQHFRCLLIIAINASELKATKVEGSQLGSLKSDVIRSRIPAVPVTLESLLLWAIAMLSDG